MVDDLLKLIERVEKATGPDRELDAEIGNAVHAEPVMICDTGNVPLYLSFTASLDAAMSLVPEGWDWSAGTGGKDCGGHAFLRTVQGKWTREIESDAATPALALTAAALRSLRSEGEGK